MLAGVRRLAGALAGLAAVGCLTIGASSAVAAKHWSGPKTISDPNETVAFPTVAINGKGHAVAVWNGQDPDTGDIKSMRAATREPGGGFDPPVTLGGASRPSGSNPPSLPSVAVDRHGDALAAWLIDDPQGNTRVVVSFRTSDGSFGPPQTLSDPGQPAFNPGVAFDRDGNAIVVWDRFDGRVSRVQAVFRSTDGELGEIQTLSPQGVPASAPQVGVSDDGQTDVIWLSQETTPPFVRFVQGARGSATGFDPPRTISNRNDSADAAHLAVSPNGTAMATWRSIPLTQIEADLATALAPPVAEFESPVLVEPQSGMDVFEPRVAMDRFGRATALWVETPPQATPGTNVVHQARTNRKGVFTSGGTLETADVSIDQTAVSVARAGNAIATWVAAPSNGASEVHAATRTRRSRQFGPPESLSPPGVFGSAPSVATNKRTGIAVWDTTTGGPATDVFANFYERR